MRISARLVVWILAITTIVACSPLPQVQVWQPWTRVTGDFKSVVKLNVDVSYTSETLPGSNYLLEREIYTNVKDLLSRRGFVVSDSDRSPWAMLVRLSTNRRDQIKTGYSSHTTYNAGFYSSRGSSSTSTGVLIASLVSGLAFQKKETVLTNINTMETYTHTIGVEIVDSEDMIVWKGESTWDSESPDVREQLITGMQLLFSSLPYDSNSHPRVPTIANGKSTNFLEVKCIGKWFSCPVLPYRISFTSPIVKPAGRKNTPSFRSSIENESALYAYYDLLQTAEYALPLGTGGFGGIENKYSDPLDKTLWTNVRLGEIYDLDGQGHVPVLIDLQAYQWGYKVKKCRIAKDEEWAEHQELQKKWNEAVEAYLDFYN